MADEQPHPCDEAFGENPDGHDILKNEYVQKIEQLMREVNIAAIDEVVNLAFISRRQQKQNDLLDHIQKQVSKENETVQENVLSEQQCLGAGQAVEKQRSSMDQKNVVAAEREEMEKLIKGLNKMAVIEKKQAIIYESLMTRFKTCKSELTASIEKQQEKNDAQRAFYDEMTAKFEFEIKKRYAEVIELSEKLKGMNEKLCKLRLKKNQAIGMLEQCKRNSVQAMFDLKQKKADLEKVLKERHDAQVAWNQGVRRLEEKNRLLENEKRTLEEQEQALIEANERYKEEVKQFELMRKQQESKGETLRD